MSNEDKRQLKIKGGSVRRLAKEIQSYTKEKQQLEDKLVRQREAKEDKHELKKTQEFIAESVAVLTDTKGRLQKALGELQEAIDTADDDLKNSAEYQGAIQDFDFGCDIASGQMQVQSPSGTLAPATGVLPAVVAAAEQKVAGEQQAALNSPSSEHFKVAIYGSSRCVKGDALYTMAENLGHELGVRAFHLITGGYMGTMEAVSEGGKRTAGTVVEGIIAPTIFPKRLPNGNAYLTLVTKADSLQDRIVSFTRKANAFVVLPGNTGTLAEFALTWNVAYIHRIAGLSPLPVFAFRDPWQKVIDAITPILGISDDDRNTIVFVDSVDEVVQHMVKLRERWQQERNK